MTIKQLRQAKENGVSIATIETRLRLGWSAEDAVNVPVAPRKQHGPWGAIRRGALAAGIPLVTVNKRLYELGWTLERALSTPPRARRAAR